MIWIYTLIIGIGGYVAATIILAEWNRGRVAAPVPVPPDVFHDGSDTGRKTTAGSDDAGRWAPGPVTPPESLEESYGRLETLLKEKQEELDRLERRLYGEIRHRKEFERLQDLLHAQIRELKEQNRLLKLDIARLSGQRIANLTTPLTEPQLVRIDSEEPLSEAKLN